MTLMASVLTPEPYVYAVGDQDVATTDQSYVFIQDSVDSIAVSNADSAAREKFLRLALQWKKETAVKSILEGVILNPSYQLIIGMGREALPFIFEDLKLSKSYWAHALFAITETDPAPANANKAQVREAWLNWGIQQRYVSA